MHLPPTLAEYKAVLQLDANPELRDLLAGMLDRGRTSPEELERIPALAGKLSVQEERVIKQTLRELQVSAPTALSSYMRNERVERSAHERLWLVKGYIHEKTMTGILLALGGTGAVAGTITSVAAGVATGGGVLALTGLALAIAATLGFSRARNIDQEKNDYGRLD